MQSRQQYETQNQQTRHGRGCSHAKAISSGNKHTQAASAKRRSDNVIPFTVHQISQIPEFSFLTFSEHFDRRVPHQLEQWRLFLWKYFPLFPTAKRVQDEPRSIKRAVKDIQWLYSSLDTCYSSKGEFMLVYACAVAGLTTVYC